jgi:hypothetical protein
LSPLRFLSTLKEQPCKRHILAWLISLGNVCPTACSCPAPGRIFYSPGRVCSSCCINVSVHSSLCCSWTCLCLEMPDRDSMNPDPQHCLRYGKIILFSYFSCHVKQIFFRVILFRSELRSGLFRGHRNALGMNTFFRGITESIPSLFRGIFFGTKFRCQP